MTFHFADLKRLKPTKRAVKRMAWPLAAMALGSGASLVWANGEGGERRPSEADVAVASLLKERLPRTAVSRVNCQVVDGVCEVTAGSQLFYVDRTARYLMIGRVYDMQTRQDLTAVRLLEVNPDLLVGGAAGSRREAETTQAPARGINTAAAREASAQGSPRTMSLAQLPEAGGIVWGNPAGKTVTVFSDFRCGYCRALSAELEAMNVRVVERPISVLGSRDLANQVFCARNRPRAVKAAYAGAAITDSKPCDTSALDANERFAREAGIAGTPVIVRSDGAAIEGYRPRAVLETWLKAVRS